MVNTRSFSSCERRVDGSFCCPAITNSVLVLSLSQYRPDIYTRDVIDESCRDASMRHTILAMRIRIPVCA